MLSVSTGTSQRRNKRRVIKFEYVHNRVQSRTFPAKKRPALKLRCKKLKRRVDILGRVSLWSPRNADFSSTNWWKESTRCSWVKNLLFRFSHHTVSCWLSFRGSKAGWESSRSFLGELTSAVETSSRVGARQPTLWIIVTVWYGGGGVSVLFNILKRRRFRRPWKRYFEKN